jgi:ubiquitin-protein ligase
MSESRKVIKTETIKRLLKDVKQIIKHPLTDNGIYYSHDENDITKGYSMIIGPSDTPYFGGYYLFNFDYPHDYPFSPPKVTYMTNDGLTRFNPNLYKCGKVCVSILNTWAGDKWSSCQTINSVLLTLCSLLNDSPLENEPGQGKQSIDFIPYQKSIEFKNIDFAICDMILKKSIPEPFENFYPFMKQNFINNYDKILDYIKTKSNEKSIQNVGIYRMTTRIDYQTLESKLVQTKQIIDSQTV